MSGVVANPFDQLAEGVIQRPWRARRLEQPVTPAELPTPALTLSRTALSSNIERMSTHLSSAGKQARPHCKTHKCPEIAHLQMRAGAVGVCCAKLSEAIVMLSAGIESVLITSPLVSASKISLLNRILQLQSDSTCLSLVVDSERGLNLLEEAISGPCSLQILIDLDIAMGRTGARDDDLVLRLIDRIDAHNHLHFAGFQHYAGHLMHLAGFDQRRRASLELWNNVIERIERFGISYEILTGSGTGTFDIDTEVDEITDLQVGSYTLMDEEYRLIGSPKSDRFTPFEVALHIQTTAISQPSPATITLDAGYKAMASETVMPVCDDLAETKFRFAGDEHGVLVGEAARQGIVLGDVVKLVSPHCDPTVNLHDWYWVVDDDGLIRESWPISARGCSW